MMDAPQEIMKLLSAQDDHMEFDIIKKQDFKITIKSYNLKKSINRI